MWRQAQAARRKMVQLSVGKAESDWNAAFSRSEISSFSGALNEKHRLFVLSTDLLEENQAAPWHTVGSITNQKDEVKKMIQWAKAQCNKISDFFVIFDGRSLLNRPLIEDTIGLSGLGSTVSEVWISYVEGTGTRAGRRVFGAASTKETGYLVGNVSRVRINTAEREDLREILEPRLFHLNVK